MTSLAYIIALATSTAAASSAPTAAAPPPIAAPAREAAAPQAPDPKTIVGRSASVYRSLASLRADFVQRIEDEMVGDSESRGSLVQAGEAKLAMRFADPQGDAVIIDGERLWIYTPSTTPGQVLRMALPSGGPVYGFNLLAWFLDRPAERYEMKYVRADRVGGQAVDVVELVPIQPDMPFRRATIWIARGDALPRRLEIDERAGGTRTVTLSNLRLNASVPASAFRFDVPAGVRVIDQ
jgi:outer membrane lipoprotein carrier protein